MQGEMFHLLSLALGLTCAQAARQAAVQEKRRRKDQQRQSMKKKRWRAQNGSERKVQADARR